MKISQFYGKDQFLVYHDNFKKVSLQSYDSLVAEYDIENHILKIFEHYNYSRTTSKYFNLFLKEIVLNEYDFKDLIKIIKKEDNGNYKEIEYKKLKVIINKGD